MTNFDKENLINDVIGQINKIDKFGFKKILNTKNNKVESVLLRFIFNNENIPQIKISSIHLASLIERGSLILSFLEMLYENRNNLNIEHNNNLRLGKEDLELLFQIIIYSFLFGIYENLDHGDSDPNQINLMNRSYNTLIMSINDLVQQEDDFYRGQQIDCPMSPSIIRSLNRSIRIDKESFSELIGNEKNQRYHERFYDEAGLYSKMAYFQHSTNYSPFLDFTSNKLVASVFALSNSHDINVFDKTDSIVFGIKQISIGNVKNVVDKIDDANSFLENEYYLDVLNSSFITLFKNYKIVRYVNKNGKIEIVSHPISFGSFFDIYRYLTPKFRFINVKTNDRMKYQYGLFLVFYGCVALKDRIYYEFNSSFSLHKYIISSNLKRKILNDIYSKYRFFDLDHLMNPYLFLKE